MELRTEEKNYVPFVRIQMVKERELSYAMEDISRPEKVADLVKKVLADADREYVLALSLDAGMRLAAIEIVSIGTVNHAPVEPREIFKHAILANATGIIMAHSHTSGRCVPSNEDIQITRRIEKAGNLLGIPLIDHIIVGDGYFSFREEKMLL